MKTAEAGGVDWTFGLATETFHGEGSGTTPRWSSGMEGPLDHYLPWAYELTRDPRLYSEHECYHLIDTQDTLGHYINNLKIRRRSGAFPGRFRRGVPVPPRGGLAEGLDQCGFIHPPGSRLSEGPHLRLGLEGEATVNLTAKGSARSGITARSELIVNQDGYHPGQPGGGAFLGHSEGTRRSAALHLLPLSGRPPH
jgi:hypothetical protein